MDLHIRKLELKARLSDSNEDLLLLSLAYLRAGRETDASRIDTYLRTTRFCCGKRMDGRCGQCDSVVCDGCRKVTTNDSVCVACNDYFCSNCVMPCDRCRDRVCDGCQITDIAHHVSFCSEDCAEAFLEDDD